ncbi:hypothetical protein JXB41_02720 [Candidatus Woesearchaeota archaeon]|nr:hypothetical protein [Candidatus Woesearchaeota archaeon]
MYGLSVNGTADISSVTMPLAINCCGYIASSLPEFYHGLKKRINSIQDKVGELKERQDKIFLEKIILAFDSLMEDREGFAYLVLPWLLCGVDMAARKAIMEYSPWIKQYETAYGLGPSTVYHTIMGYTLTRELIKEGARPLYAFAICLGINLLWELTENLLKFCGPRMDTITDIGAVTAGSLYAVSEDAYKKIRSWYTDSVSQYEITGL